MRYWHGSKSLLRWVYVDGIEVRRFFVFPCCPVAVVAEQLRDYALPYLPDTERDVQLLVPIDSHFRAVGALKQKVSRR